MKCDARHLAPCILVSRKTLKILASTLLGFVFGTIFLAALISAQAQEQIPLPEYYGIYAVMEGELIKLDSNEVKVKRTIPVRVGWRSAVGNILNGEAVAGSRERHMPEFSPGLKIIVYQQTGMVSPMDVADSLQLEEFVFVRNVSVDTGWPNNVRRSGAENGWEAGDAPELLGMTRGDRAKALEFLVKPVPGQQEMVLGVLRGPLRPGVYRLSVGPRDPLLGGGGFMFAIPPVSEGETLKCVDAQVKYAMMMSDVKFMHCAATTGSSTPGGASVGSSLPTPTAPSGTRVSCSDYNSCLNSSVVAFQSGRWDESLSYSEEASRLAPERGEAYVMMAGAYFERGDYNKFYEMADKGLSLGSVATAKICRDRFGVCEQGTLLLSRQEVALTNTRQQKVFSAPPSQVTSRPATLYSLASAAYSWLTVAGKNYRLYLIPEAVQCQIDLVPICPEPGFTQQKVFANYVHHAIQRLASGTLTKPEPPPAPATFAVVPGGTIGQFRHGTLVISGSWEVAQTPQQATHTHAGVDIAADIGTPVYALADGTVVDMIVSDRDVNFDSLGYMVIIKHTQPIEGKATYSAYFHLHEPPAVAFNQAVLGGRTQIGVVGKWGAATGPHLHLEVRHFRSRFFEHPEWNNIYGVGDQRSKPAFLENWSDPEKLGVKLY
jgi:murein DD-endopeptidase MepM/ murein hydrolase activator NlpD